MRLLEADLKLPVKIIIARQWVWHGERRGTFGEEAQADGQSRRSANAIVLREELTCDTAHLTLISLAMMMETDTTACSDQMIPSLVNIALQASRGTPKEIAQFICATLVKM